MKIIQSRTNPEIKQVASLHTQKYRKQYQQFIAEGARVCSTLINTPLKLHALYVTENNREEVTAFIDRKKITVVSDAVMAKLSAAQTPSGIVGVFAIPSAPAVQKLNSGLVLANITDPGNMGTLIRSCAAFGFDTVVIVEGVDPWSPKVVQASAGTLGLVNIFQYSWQMLMQYKNKQQLSLYALVAHDGEDPKKLSLEDVLLVVGNESTGIPNVWLRDCDQQLTIPMPGAIESLNAAVAGSLALYVMAAWNKKDKSKIDK